MVYNNRANEEKKESFNMNMEFIRKLPIPQELKKQFSLSDKLIAVKAARDAEIQKVLRVNLIKSF